MADPRIWQLRMEEARRGIAQPCFHPSEQGWLLRTARSRGWQGPGKGRGTEEGTALPCPASSKPAARANSELADPRAIGNRVPPWDYKIKVENYWGG